MLVNGANVNIRNQSGETALVNAIQERQYNIATLLKKYGAIE